MSSQDPQSDLTRLERLAALVREDEMDVEAMSNEQLALYLKDNKVDMTAPQKRFDAILKKAEARRRLEIAHQRRLAAVEKTKGMLSAGTEAVVAVRERVRSMIEKFSQHDPEQAQVYAREFEKATPEDLLCTRGGPNAPRNGSARRWKERSTRCALKGLPGSSPKITASTPPGLHRSRILLWIMASYAWRPI